MLTRTSLSAVVGGDYSRSLYEPFAASIQKDGAPMSGSPYTNISASAVRHIGFGFKPYVGAEGPGGRFSVLTMRESPRTLVRNLHKLRKGLRIEDPRIDQSVAAELRIELENEMRPMVDGDLLEPRKEFTLRIGPAVDLITG